MDYIYINLNKAPYYFLQFEDTVEFYSLSIYKVSQYFNINIGFIEPLFTFLNTNLIYILYNKLINIQKVKHLIQNSGSRCGINLVWSFTNLIECLISFAKGILRQIHRSFSFWNYFNAGHAAVELCCY